MRLTLPLLLFFLFFLSATQGVKILSSTFEVKNSILLGRDLTVVNFEVTLSEDLYIWEPLFCLPPSEECLKVGSDPEDLCDYSPSPQNCSNSVQNPSLNCSIQTCSGNWTPLVRNQPVTLKIPEYEVMNFRFFFCPTKMFWFLSQYHGHLWKCQNLFESRFVGGDTRCI
eukprot:TRINITY_DN6587_c0_g1_i1.p1 TRINITY_DN6587_c0_g1~~TRINITY_DN6587_c0_g1_i1.p1  ORF type:complete len:194 (-),score=25.83 TRINITY_DN6587_c0_g1_i1:258-764(-)